MCKHLKKIQFKEKLPTIINSIEFMKKLTEDNDNWDNDENIKEELNYQIEYVNNLTKELKSCLTKLNHIYKKRSKYEILSR